MARLSQDAELVAFFNRPAERERLRLVPASFTLDDAFVPGYQRLCASRRKPADCLNLLQDGLFDADDRQTVATSIAFHSVLAGVAQELGRSADPDRVYAMVTSAMVGFMVTLAFPDPITKILLAALALTAISYIGWDTFYSIRDGWLALKHQCASATKFADLEEAGQQFGTIVGENVGRIVVMPVVAAMGASLGSFTARLSSLPGFTRAAELFQLRLGLSLGTVAAGEVTAVTISASGATIALASGVTMPSVVNSGQQWDPNRPAMITNQGGGDASARGRELLQDLLSIKNQKGLGGYPSRHASRSRGPWACLGQRERRLQVQSRRWWLWPHRWSSLLPLAVQAESRHLVGQLSRKHVHARTRQGNPGEEYPHAHHGHGGSMMSSGFKVSGLSKIHEHWGDDPSEFLLQFHCEVVRPGESGGDAFQVTVASPRQLAKELEHSDGFEFGRGYIFLLDYDERVVISRLQTLIDGSGAMSWNELAAYVAKYFDWID